MLDRPRSETSIRHEAPTAGFHLGLEFVIITTRRRQSVRHFVIYGVTVPHVKTPCVNCTVLKIGRTVPFRGDLSRGTVPPQTYLSQKAEKKLDATGWRG